MSGLPPTRRLLTDKRQQNASRMELIYDKLRHARVSATPEELVRQWFISVLEKQCRVPVERMRSEVSFKLGEKSFRADILIWDRQGTPLAVVECKRPEVNLSPAVLEQARCYDLALGGLKWLILTNGKSTFVFRREDLGFKVQAELPDYEKMLGK